MLAAGSKQSPQNSTILLINDKGNLSRTKKNSQIESHFIYLTYQVLSFSWFHSACSTVGSGCSQGMKNILQWKRHIDSYGTTSFSENATVRLPLNSQAQIFWDLQKHYSPPFLYFLHKLVVFFGGLNAFNYTFTIRRALK